MKKSLLAKSILCSVMAAGMAILITPPQEAVAASINELKTDAPGYSQNGKFEGSGDKVDSITITGSETTVPTPPTIIGGQGGNSKLTISNLNEFNIVNNNEALINNTTQYWAIASWSGANVNVNNVNTVTIGTDEAPVHVGQTGIIAIGGNIKFDGIKDFNMNVLADGPDDKGETNDANAMMAQAGSTVEINASGKVNIKSDGGAVLSGVLSESNTPATLNIKAGTVDIESTESRAVQAYAQLWKSDPKVELSGKADININATGDISLKGATDGVLVYRPFDGGASQINVISSDGNVNIEGKNQAVRVAGVDGKSAQGTIEGKNVSLLTGNAENKAISSEGGILNINQTDENGRLIIDGVTNIGSNNIKVTKPQYNDDGTIKKDANGKIVYEDEPTVYHVGGTLNLSAKGDTSQSSGAYNVVNSGEVNFKQGKWAINSWSGDKSGVINQADNTQLNVNTKVDVSKFTAGENSTTSFDVSKNASINVSNENNIIVADSAIAIVYGANRNTEYKLLTANGNKLTDKTLDFRKVTSGDNKYLNFTLNEDGSITTSLDSAAAKAALPDTVISNVAANDKLSGDTAAAKFFDKALVLAGKGDAKTAANSLNSVANIGELGGTSHGTYTASNIMTDLVNEHLSLATHGDQDRDLWAYFIHNRENIDGMSLGGIDAAYDANYNGVIVGGEFYNKGKVSAGAAFSYMDGSIKGNTLTARTENDADYYGLSLYGKIDNGDSAVFGDISYLHGKNDITQTNMGEKITADPKSDAFSIGVRAEKSFEAGAGQLVPYIGARYMKLGVGDYKDSFGINYDADEQDLFMVPVGVSYSTEIKHNDWTVSPYAKAGYVWTFGDRETDQTVSLAGAADTFGFETADSGSFVGQLGINAENDAMSYGFGYSYQKGDSVQANKWMANVLFKF